MNTILKTQNTDKTTSPKLQFSFQDKNFQEWLFQGLEQQQPNIKFNEKNERKFITCVYKRHVRDGNFNGLRLNEAQRIYLLNLFSGDFIILNKQGKIIKGLNNYINNPDASVCTKAEVFFEALGKGSKTNSYTSVGVNHLKIEELLSSIKSPQEMVLFTKAVELNFISGRRKLSQILEAHFHGPLLSKFKSIIAGKIKGYDFDPITKKDFTFSIEDEDFKKWLYNGIKQLSGSRIDRLTNTVQVSTREFNNAVKTGFFNEIILNAEQKKYVLNLFQGEMISFVNKAVETEPEVQEVAQVITLIPRRVVPSSTLPFVLQDEPILTTSEEKDGSTPSNLIYLNYNEDRDLKKRGLVAKVLPTGGRILLLSEEKREVDLFQRTQQSLLNSLQIMAHKDIKTVSPLLLNSQSKVEREKGDLQRLERHFQNPHSKAFIQNLMMKRLKKPQVEFEKELKEKSNNQIRLTNYISKWKSGLSKNAKFNDMPDSFFVMLFMRMVMAAKQSRATIKFDSG